MVIRRLADKDENSKSLWRLIQRIRANPSIASREIMNAEVTKRSGVDIAAFMDAQLAQMYLDAESPPDPVLEAMQEELVRDLESVITFVDRNVAHRDPRGRNHIVTYAEVHDALDRVMDVANRVSSMLRYSSTAYSMVAIQGDWQECFRPGLFPIGFGAYYWPDPCGFT